MTSQAVFYGGGRDAGALSADLDLVVGGKRVVLVDPQFGGLAVNLPDATEMPLGGPHFVLVNESGVNDITIKDGLGATVTTLQAGKMVTLALAAQGDAGGTWFREIWNANS